MRALILAALLVTTPAAAAEEWQRADTMLLSATLGALAVDWLQTRSIVKTLDHPPAYGCAGPEPTSTCTPPDGSRRYFERNPLLGREPSEQRVNAYFAGAMIGTAAAAYYMPRAWRRAFLGATLTVELAVIHHNYAAGVRIDF